MSDVLSALSPYTLPWNPAFSADGITDLPHPSDLLYQLTLKISTQLQAFFKKIFGCAAWQVGSIKGVLMKDYIKDVVKLLHQRGLFEWSDGHRSQVWRLRGEEVVLCQCQVLSQHVCPRDGGNNRDVFFAQRVTLEPPVYLRLLLFLPPSFIFTPVILVHHVHTS